MSSQPRHSDSAREQAFTLAEMLVTLALAGIVLIVIAGLFLSSLRNFAGLGNYATLCNQSRESLDYMSREVREATQLIGANTNLPVKSFTLTNAYKGILITYKWDSTAGTLTCDKTGETTRTNLTGCDQWNFSFYQRSPSNNWTFFPTTNQALCKLINMSWKCSRKILGRKMNTEEVMTAQVVLRNKP